jgi:NAD(P)-dependent dehydrogenase (short-subunit alcohol dehydrogenase family)
MTSMRSITGGAKGIGLAIARRLAADGAGIALIGRDASALALAAATNFARATRWPT